MTTTNLSRLRASAGLLVATGLLLTTSVAVAQNTDTIQISATHDFSSVDGDESLVANIRDCRDAVGDSWDFTAKFDSANYTQSDGTRSDYSLKLERSSGACTSELSQSAESCELFQAASQIPSTFQVTRAVAFSELTGVESIDDCVGQSGTVSFVVVSELIETDSTTINNGTSKDPSPISDRFSVTFKTTRPAPPTALAVTAGENNIRVAFTAPSNAPTDATYNLYITSDVDLTAGAEPEPVDEAGVRRVVGSTSTAVVVDSGVSVGVSYQVAVVTVDSDGNESILSEVATVTTSPTNDFYESFRNAGGADQGGFCTTATPTAPVSGSALALLLAAVAAGLLLRRRLGGLGRHAVAGAALVAVLAVPAVASAQFDRIESRPSGTFEIRLGTYLPEVDSGFASPGPYKQVFDDESMLLLEFEIEKVLWDGFGMAGVGVDFGFMQAVGKALDASGNSTVDTTVFNIMPFRLSGVYRFDFLAQTLDIPLVLVGKAGLDYYLWWITTGSGAIATSDDGGEGFGGTFGYHAALAVHLYLDFFNQRSANNLRFDFGILNTYFFAEYLISVVDDFGDSGSLNLSDANLMFGLAFDY